MLEIALGMSIESVRNVVIRRMIVTLFSRSFSMLKMLFVSSLKMGLVDASRGTMMIDVSMATMMPVVCSVRKFLLRDFGNSNLLRASSVFPSVYRGENMRLYRFLAIKLWFVRRAKVYMLVSMLRIVSSGWDL